ncbi:MAG: deoxyribodipyrimidine photo-lyase [Phycisphaerales bacterium JB059]
MRPLVWFRADLRTRDHPALSRATRDAERGVVAVFTICPKQWLDHDLSDAKADLILRSLRDLSADLKKLNIPLLILEHPTFAESPRALLRLAEAHACDAIYFNDELELNERERDDAVANAFEDAGLRVRRFTDQLVFPPDAIRTKEGKYYSVFTPFKKAWIARFKEGEARDEAPAPRAQNEAPCEPDPIPDTVEGFDPDNAKPDLWPAGEEHARAALFSFCADRIQSYADRRDLPDADATARLSPSLGIGALSSLQCVNAARDVNQNKLDSGAKGVSTWISEIIWREFYRCILVGFPRVCRHRPFRLETERIEWIDNPEHLEAWKEGRTGFPIVDAAMRQLIQTGWMHNRLRMIAAMFLSKDLFLDWRLGERHFSRHLIDTDLANNNGGWQWSASTGVDAAPYFRVFNPTSQSKKCDPEGAFIRRFVPELSDLDAPDIHDPSALPALARTTLDYPSPIVDHAEARQHAIEAFKAIKD